MFHNFAYKNILKLLLFSARAGNRVEQTSGAAWRDQVGKRGPPRGGCCRWKCGQPGGSVSLGHQVALHQGVPHTPVESGVGRPLVRLSRGAYHAGAAAH